MIIRLLKKLKSFLILILTGKFIQFFFFPLFTKKISELKLSEIREDFIKNELLKIKNNSILLDAGAGEQLYKKYCKHLFYKSQDLGTYTIDEKKTLWNSKQESYPYGEIDYKGNVWEINEKDNFFDAILCSEVFEHIPHPIRTIKEFSRLLKPGGKLILTAPSNSLRHFDPYFFYPGFSDRWYEFFLKENNFNIISIKPYGDYYKWISSELARTALNSSIFVKILLAPAFWYYFKKKQTPESVNTLCFGYFVVAEKK
jgi:ubiquinone/menaquinone biosynthesis C-methylase UbiE